MENSITCGSGAMEPMLSPYNSQLVSEFQKFYDGLNRRRAVINLEDPSISGGVWTK
jgi:hypothetical protein